MEEQQISVREFLRNYKDHVDKRKTIIITNRGEPKIVLVPYDKWKKKEAKKGRKITREMIEKYTFEGPPDLSQRIDEICYPYPNKLKK